jgi:hypothetical protein
MAAAGILACAGALLDAFIPKGSVLGFLTWMVVLGIIVIGTVVGYTWVCDKCESYFNGRLDRLFGKSKRNHSDTENPPAEAIQRPTEPKIVDEARPTPDAPQSRSLRQYILTLRGSVLPNATGNASAPCGYTWHGQ